MLCIHHNHQVFQLKMLHLSASLTGVPQVSTATRWFWAAGVRRAIAAGTRTPTCCSPTATR